MPQVQQRASLRQLQALSGSSNGLAALSGQLAAGINLYGPFTASSGNLPVAGEEHSVTVAHKMPTTPVAVFGGLQDGFYSPCLGWRWEADAVHVTITFHTLQSQSKVEGTLKFLAC